MSNALTNLKELPHHLALNLQMFRLQRGHTQQSLAKLAKIPRSTITYMESGSGNPSLQNLMKVAEALGVGLEEILSRPKEDYILVKNEEVKKVVRSGGNATIMKLLPEPIPGTEMDYFTLKSEAKLSGIPHLPHTREHLYLMEGNLKVIVSGRFFDLGKGDVLSFPGDQTHSYENVGKKTVEALSVVVFARSIL
ncbi:MAG: helix-turn-helix domain-containing protein [Bacteriovoracaceae bacterium]